MCFCPNPSRPAVSIGAVASIASETTPHPGPSLIWSITSSLNIHCSPLSGQRCPFHTSSSPYDGRIPRSDDSQPRTRSLFRWCAAVHDSQVRAPSRRLAQLVPGAILSASANRIRARGTKPQDPLRVCRYSGFFFFPRPCLNRAPMHYSATFGSPNREIDRS